MPFATIYIPDFPAEAMVRAEPELRERAVVVVDGTPPLVRVIAVNERAAQAGVEPGMTKLEAEGILAAMDSNGVIRQRSTEREAAAHAALLDCACGFSPRVEDTAADTVLLNLSGLERVFGAPAKIARDVARRCSERGLEANVAVASNADAAILAARGFAGVTVIAEGKEAERLGELSVEILLAADWGKTLPIVDCRLPGEVVPRPESRVASEKSQITNRQSEILETLERWGVRNLRALAALPEVALAERLGQEGLYLQKLARGEMRRALVIAEPPLVFEEAAELEYPIDLLEPLAFLLSHMLEQLCARLEARALAANEIRLRLELERSEDLAVDGRWSMVDRQVEEVNGRQPTVDGNKDYRIEGNAGTSAIPQFGNSAMHERTLRLPVPMVDAKVFLKLMQLDLQAHPPQAPVVKVWLRAEPAEPRRTQNGLFAPEAPEAERLELTLARIEKVVRSTATEQRVGSPELVDTHRADGWRMKRFSAEALGDELVSRNPELETRKLPPTIDQSLPRAEPRGPSTISPLRVFRPALVAVVEMKDGQPVKVASPERPTMRGEVVWCAGPWRSSGEWWSEQAWSRQEWEVAVRNEAGVTVYRIYRDEIAGRWLVEGSYD